MSDGKNKKKTTFVQTLWEHDKTLCLFGFLLLGLVLRFYNIGYPALHHDEAYSINGILTPSWEALKAHIQFTDIFPPLIYLIQKAVYQHIPTVIAMRSLSAIAGIAAIGLAYWAVLPLVHRRRAVLFAGLCALSYFMIWYSREIRSYMFHFASGLLALGFLIRLAMSTRTRPPVRLLAGFFIGNALGLQFHYNMLLAWPLMGLLFVLWEVLRMREEPLRGFRWNYVVTLALAGILAVLTMLPILPLFLKAVTLAGGEKVIPPLDLVYRKICSTGWGTGWLGIVWCTLLALGFVRAFRTNRRVFLLLTLFLFGTLVLYLYVVRFPINFTRNLQKYTFLYSFAALLAAAYGIEQLASFLSAAIRRLTPRKVRPVVLDLVLLLALSALASPVFFHYYKMEGASFLFKTFNRVLTDLGPRNLLIDNYYDLQYTRHYLPAFCRTAYPPVYGTPDEFEKYGDARFIRKLAEADPLFVFWDSLSARGYAAFFPTDWSWLNTQFAHCETLHNTIGVYLNHRALNFHPFREDKTGDMAPPHLYYNTLEELPQWFRDRKQTCGTAFGANWGHLTYLGIDNQWRHAYLTADTATFYVCNATSAPISPVRLDLQFAGCASQQTVTLYQENHPILRTLNNGTPVNGFDFRSQKTFKQYIPLGRLAGANGELPSLPAALQWDVNHLVVTNLTLAPGCTLFKVGTSSPDGLLVESVSATLP